MSAPNRRDGTCSEGSATDAGEQESRVADDDCTESDRRLWARVQPLLVQYRAAHMAEYRAALGAYYRAHPTCSWAQVARDVYHVWNVRMVRAAWTMLDGAGRHTSGGGGGLRGHVADDHVEEVDVVRLCCTEYRRCVDWFPECDRVEFLGDEHDDVANVVAAFGGDDMYASADALSRALFGGRRSMFEYQFEDVVRVVRSGHSYVLNLQMGLGKTTEGWALIKHQLLHRRRLWYESRRGAAGSLAAAAATTATTVEAAAAADEPALIVAPKGVLCNWIAEAHEYAFAAHEWSRVYVYQGPQRTNGRGYVLRSLVETGGDYATATLERIPRDAFAILTTYDVVRIDSAKGRFLRRVPRFSVLLLDEAHLVRNATLIDRATSGADRLQRAKEQRTSSEGGGGSKRAAAVFALVSRCALRYALTGTPFVNADTDLMALAKFVNYGACQDRISWLASTPKDSPMRLQRLGEWMRECMVVRRKEEVVHDLPFGLPAKHTCVSRLVFGAAERGDYDAIVTDIKEVLRENATSSMSACSAHLLALFTYLRQVCLSVLLVTDKELVYAWFRDAASVDDARLVRAVRESVKLRTILSDLYRFGYMRVRRALRDVHAEIAAPGRHATTALRRGDVRSSASGGARSGGCSGGGGGGGVPAATVSNWAFSIAGAKRCREDDDVDDDDGDDAANDLGNDRKCCKAAAAAAGVEVCGTANDDDDNDSNDDDGNGGKGRTTTVHAAAAAAPPVVGVRMGEQQLRGERIVLSSESKIGVMLISVALRNEAVRRYLQVDHLPAPDVLVYTGDVVSLGERDDMLRRFRGDDDDDAVDNKSDDGRAVVFLMTRACGGLGINLMRARHIVVCDGWWHDAAVAQSIDRVHRIGQRRTVYVHRYPVEGSIEQYLLLLETRKHEQAMRLWGTKEQQAVARLRHEALQKAGTDGMLKDMVKYLRDRTSAATATTSWWHCAQGARQAYECSQATASAAVAVAGAKVVVVPGTCGTGGAAGVARTVRL